jgi:hypothetical protein
LLTVLAVAVADFLVELDELPPQLLRSMARSEARAREKVTDRTGIDAN